MHAARARLRRGGCEHPFHELRIPGAGQGDRLREARGLLRLEAVERLLVEEHGNAEAGAVLHPALDGVRVFSLCPGPVTLVRPFDPADTDPKPPRWPRRI